MSPRAIRIGLVVLLVGGAYLAASPWLQYTFPFGLGRWYPEIWGLCSFGSGIPAYGPGPLWPHLVIAAPYLLAALYLARGPIAIIRASDRRSD
jgi:hypothetical protein